MFEMRPYNRRNHIANYNPFREIDEFEKNFFNDFPSFADNALTEFKTDIADNGDSYLLEADLPGFDKKDIKIDLNGDCLTIKAERHSEHEENDKKGKYLRCERSYGSYSRQFDVSGVETDKIKAKYDNGVLSLTMPKKAEQTSDTKHLEIE